MEDEKPIIQFSHANGFPGSSYQQLYNLLREYYHIDYIDAYAMEEEYQVTDNWHELTMELVDRIKQHQRPVIAVGHSLGGVLSLMAACKSPGIIKQVIMLDAPYFAIHKRFGIKIMKLFDKTHILTPGGRNVLSRRREWGTIQDVIEYMHSKTLFKGFAPECLEDWAKYATYEVSGKRRLKIDPEIEYKIYGTLPHIGMPRSILKQLDVTAVIGKETKMVDSIDQFMMKYFYGFKMHNVPGGHMFPFQYPRKTAELVHKIISDTQHEKELEE
jgi:pimeloyl-ACP methyl ester carboxylesterase